MNDKNDKNKKNDEKNNKNDGTDKKIKKKSWFRWVTTAAILFAAFAFYILPMFTTVDEKKNDTFKTYNEFVAYVEAEQVESVEYDRNYKHIQFV